MHSSELLRIHFFPWVETVNRFIEILQKESFLLGPQTAVLIQMQRVVDVLASGCTVFLPHFCRGVRRHL